nr:hypothetical protein [Tanacetum cinerariifolium]
MDQDLASTWSKLIKGIGNNCGYLLKRRKVLVAPGMPKLNLSRNESRIRLLIKRTKKGRMILDSVDEGLLVYPTVVGEDGHTRPKKYYELTEAQQLQDDYDVQATNIILHGLPPDVYALFNHQEAAKDI